MLQPPALLVIAVTSYQRLIGSSLHCKAMSANMKITRGPSYTIFCIYLTDAVLWSYYGSFEVKECVTTVTLRSFSLALIKPELIPPI